MEPELNLESQTPDNQGSAVEQNTEEKQYSAVELKAIEQGWIPKEEFDGDEDDFIDAREFVRRGELFSKIESQSKEVRALRKALDAFKDHHNKVKEAEYNRALKALQEERRRSIVDGDHERAFAIEDKITEFEAEKKQVVLEADAPAEDNGEYTEVFQGWVENNEWYETNKAMRKAADAIGLEYHQEGYSAAEVLKMVARDIRKEFPEKFQKKQPTSTVESASRQQGRRETFSMNDDEKRIMREIVRSGVMTEAQYIAELKRTR